MIALCVDTIETAVECDAANSLAVARSELNRRRYVEAGQSLHRALLQYLEADCHYYHCLPDGTPSIQALADALLNVEFLAPLGHTWVGEIADVAADAIAGRLVPLSKFYDALHTLEVFLEHSPYSAAGKGGRA